MIRRMYRSYAKYIQKSNSVVTGLKDRLDVYDSDIDRKYKLIHDDDMSIYSSIPNKRLVEIIRIVLSGRTFSHMNKSDMTTFMDYIIKYDLGTLPDDHLFAFTKWIGTSVVRKFNFRRSQSLLVKMYRELEKRGALDSILIYRRDTSTKQLFTSDDIYDSYDSILHDDLYINRLNSIYTDIKKDLNVLYRYIDLLVELSNLNIYIHEYYASIKILLLYMMRYDDDVHKHIYYKITNIYWSMRRVSQDDGNNQDIFYEKLLSYYIDIVCDAGNVNRIMNYLWCLSMEYTLNSDERYNSILVDNIKKVLDIYTSKLITRDSRIYNSKYSYMICQISISLYKEIGYNMRYNSLDHVSISSDNPFKKYYSTIESMLRPALWIVHTNIDSKKGSSNDHLTYIEGDDRNILVTKQSVFSDATRSFEKKVIDQIMSNKKIDSIETNIIIGFYEIDILLNNNTIISCDSVYHYIFNTRYKTLVSNKIRDIHLKYMGIQHFYSIDYDKFNDAKHINNLMKHMNIS